MMLMIILNYYERNCPRFEECLDNQDAFDFPEGMIVLNGQVFGALNLPVTSADEKDGRVFFRVLYVEGGSASTMFRCKTTIYKSDVSSDLSDPIWDDAVFRFEMVLPDGQDESDIQGEILIAVYRNRAAGGSDFIGQVSYQLQDMIRSGTTGEQGEGIVSRTVTGAQPLVARLGDIAGGRATLEADLTLCWRATTATSPLPATSAGNRPLKGSSVAPSRWRWLSHRVSKQGQCQTQERSGGGCVWQESQWPQTSTGTSSHRKERTHSWRKSSVTTSALRTRGCHWSWKTGVKSREGKGSEE